MHDETRPCVLIAEDETMVAMLLEDLLDAAGYRVLLASRVEEGMALARTERLDVAILDVNLAREASFPIADELTRSGVPFLFASGYGAEELPERYRHHPMLQKPFDLSEIKVAIRGLGIRSGVPSAE